MMMVWGREEAYWLWRPQTQATKNTACGFISATAWWGFKSSWLGLLIEQSSKTRDYLVFSKAEEMLSTVFHTWHNIMKELETSQLSRPTVGCEWFLGPGAALMCKRHKVQGEHTAGRESGVSPWGPSAHSSDLWVLPQGRIPVSPHAHGKGARGACWEQAGCPGLAKTPGVWI